MANQDPKDTSTPKTRPANAPPPIDKNAFLRDLREYAKNSLEGGNRGSVGFGPSKDEIMAERKKKNKEDDGEKPVTPPPDTPTTTPLGKPKSNNWNDIVGFYFPESDKAQYKAGGLVRGGGAAQRGRGRGRIV